MQESITTLIDQIPLGIILFSRNGKVEYVNRNFHKFSILYHFDLPISDTNLFETNLFQNFNIIKEIKSIIKGIPFEKELRKLETQGGGTISLFVKGFPVYEEENISGGMLILEDLRILSDTPEDIKLKSRLTEDYLNKSDDFIIAVDTKGDIKFSAGKDTPKLKLSRTDVTGKNIGEVFNSFDTLNLLEAFSSAIKSRKTQLVDFVVRDSGSITSAECKIDPVLGENGSVQFLYLIFNTKADKEDKIEASTEEEEVVADRPVILKKEVGEFPTIKFEKSGSILLANQSFKSLLQFPDIDLYSKNFFDLVKSEESSNFKSDINKIKAGKRKTFPVKMKNYYGIEIISDLTLESEQAADDSSEIIIGTFGNQFENEIKILTESIHESLFTASQDGLAVEMDGKVLLANDSFAKIFEFAQGSELQHKNILDLVSGDDVYRVRDYINSKKSGFNLQDRIEFLAKKKGGSTFYAEFSAAAFRQNSDTLLVILATDVTERKRAQKVIKESEEKYRSITENIDDFLYTYERAGNFFKPLFFTTAVQKVTGFTQDDFLFDSKFLLKIIHPDDLPEVKRKLKLLGHSKSDTTSDFELRLINKDGNVVWVRNKLNVIRSADGRILKIYGLVSDITFNKRAEEELKESATNLRKLNEAKDRFLSIISHDLRTPFSSILGFTDLLLEDEALSDFEKKQYISYIQDSSKAMLALVNSLLDWTRLQTGRIKFEPEKINAREIVESSISTVSGNAVKKGIKIQNLVDEVYFLFVDKSLAMQTFNNLLSNAVKYTKRGDQITISARPASAARFLEFSVKDTGKGIKPENLGKLFNIDTKFSSEGTAGEKGSGLGLSLVKEIILKHGGTIDVQSEYQKGSQFIFTLPIASAKILLVEPNKRDRILYSKILMNIAPEYAVSIVSNGSEAIERIKISPPTLVITEHQMPVMNGYNLILQLEKLGLKPITPIIVLSGSIDRFSIQQYSDLGIENIFTKPVNLKSFKEAIDKLIKKSILASSYAK